MEDPIQLKVGHPVTTLYEEGASITKYLTFISLKWSCSLNVFLKARKPFTCTYSPENPTNAPLKGFSFLGSRHNPSKVPQYNTSIKIP